MWDHRRSVIITSAIPSERIQRGIDTFLDEADTAASEGSWSAVAEKAHPVLAIDAKNEAAAAFLHMAVGNGISESPTPDAGDSAAGEGTAACLADWPDRIL